MQTFQLILKNQIKELEKLAINVEELSVKWNIPTEIVMEINLVLEELFTNVVFYAYDDKMEHNIILDFVLIDEHHLKICLEDDGKPFNLLEKNMNSTLDKSIEDRQIGGLGIHFVRELMNSVDYKRTVDKNIVILMKNF
ncbi:MAG: ATP-binding protein [Bacteroidales bacterium]|jgi:anti-sigma regulatory factor (Ser/Thr protein kinase)